MTEKGGLLRMTEAAKLLRMTEMAAPQNDRAW
jgi:hypothetical protein